jgi:hypothetical protein
MLTLAGIQIQPREAAPVAACLATPCAQRFAMMAPLPAVAPVRWGMELGPCWRPCHAPGRGPDEHERDHPLSNAEVPVAPPS